MPATTTGQVLRLLKQRHGVNNVVITGYNIGAEVHTLTVSLPGSSDQFPDAVPFAVFTERRTGPSQPARWVRSSALGQQWTLHLYTVRLALEYLGLAPRAIPAEEDPNAPAAAPIPAPTSAMVNAKTHQELHRARLAEVAKEEADLDDPSAGHAGRRCPSCLAIQCKHGLCWQCGIDDDCAECAHTDEGDKQR